MPFSYLFLGQCYAGKISQCTTNFQRHKTNSPYYPRGEKFA